MDWTSEKLAANEAIRRPLLLKPMSRYLIELSTRCLNDKRRGQLPRITLSNRLGKKDILTVLIMASSDRLEAFTRAMNRWEQRAHSREASDYSRQTPRRSEMRMLPELLMSNSNLKAFPAFIPTPFILLYFILRIFSQVHTSSSTLSLASATLSLPNRT